MRPCGSIAILTMNWAATSDKGDGAAACADPAQLAERLPVDAEHHERRHLRRSRTQDAVLPRRPPQPLPRRTAGAGPRRTPPGFPELVRNSYPEFRLRG